jgi:hypothetical protein
MQRHRLALVVTAGLIGFGAPVPAHAAQGSFLYWVTAQSGNPTANRHQLNDPPPNQCATLITGDQAGEVVNKVQNNTDTPAAVFENQDCTGHHLTVPTHGTRTPGGHGPRTFRSVKFRATP